MAPTPPLPIRSDRCCAQNNAVLVLMNTALLLWWMELRPFLSTRPNAPAKPPEVSNAFCYRHIPLERKSIKNHGGRVIFEDRMLGPNPFAGFQKDSRFILPWHTHRKSPHYLLGEILASDNPELFLSFEKLKKSIIKDILLAWVAPGSVPPECLLWNLNGKYKGGK